MNPGDLDHTTTRQAVSMAAFAEAMRRQDVGFARLLERHAARFGSMSVDELCVAAQAHYVCWHEAGFPGSLVAACSAVGSGHANAMSLCLQISPERWDRLHVFVAAVQRWLGRDLPLGGLSCIDVGRAESLLGQPTPLRRALARIYLWTLVEHLRYHVSLSQLAADPELVNGDHACYSAVHREADGAFLGEPAETEAFLARQACRIEQDAKGREPPVQDLLQRLLAGRPGTTRPACMHRFVRHQEIRLASIGALRWRGELPADRQPRARWREQADGATAVLRDWMDGKAADDAFGQRLQAALGEPKPHRVSLVEHFLLAAPESTAMWDWLVADARENRRRPADVWE